MNAALTAKQSPRKRAELKAEDLQELAVGIANALEGQPPAAFEQRPQGPKLVEPSPSEPKDLAVRHVLAARAGLIDDKSPNATVRTLLAVSSQTIRDWVNAEKANPTFITRGIDEDRERVARGLYVVRELYDIRRLWQLLNAVNTFKKTVQPEDG